jgi:acetyltransferase-like isoleucine patch superfamily enzyme
VDHTPAPNEYFPWERPGPKLVLQRFYERWAVRANVTLGNHVHVGFGSIVWAPHSLRVGKDVYIGKCCTIQCDGEIGNGVLIGNSVGLVGRLDHDYKAMGLPASLSPWIGGRGHRPAAGDLRLVVSDDVWIGYGAIVLTGVTIGRGAIVAAGTVVVDDVQPYDIVAGNPARPVGRRFSDDEIEEHERALALRDQSLPPARGG